MAYTLEASPREGKTNPRALRRQGFVPAVLYGASKSQPIAVKQKDLETLLHKITRSSRVSLRLNGKEIPAFIKEIQYNEVTDAVIHIDFYVPGPEREIKMDVPLRLRGEATGRKAGGVLNQIRELIKVKGPAEKIPPIMEVDITELEMGQVLHVSDLKLEGVQVLLPGDAPIVSIVAPRKEEVVAAVPGVEGAVPVEGAVEGAPVAAEGAVATAAEQKPAGEEEKAKDKEEKKKK